jgi:hypothetical protein
VLTNEDIIVKDSCILFDLIDMGLLSHFFQLNLKVHTTLQVINEIKKEEQLIQINKHIADGTLNVDKIGTHEDISNILSQCPGLSYADSSVLELTSRLNGVVLSSDKSLKNESIRRNFSVRGILWIIQELHANKIITPEIAIMKLELYPTFNNRVPKTEIANLISSLKQKHLLS